MQGREHVLVRAPLHGRVCCREQRVDLLPFPNDSFSKMTLRFFPSWQTNAAAVGPDSCITTKQRRGLGGTQSCTSHLQSHFSTVVVPRIPISTQNSHRPLQSPGQNIIFAQHSSCTRHLSRAHASFSKHHILAMRDQSSGTAGKDWKSLSGLRKPSKKVRGKRTMVQLHVIHLNLLPE